ncbi:MAG: diguanylate cyclase domain-containing protein [Rhodocyclaceae bacterium]
MTLRKRLLWLAIPLFFLTMAAVLLGSDRILLGRYDAADGAALRADVVRVDTLLRLEAKRMRDVARNYAWWSESMRFIASEEPAFADDNLNSDAIAHLGLDFMVYVAADGRRIGERWLIDDLGRHVDPEHDLIDLLPENLHLDEAVLAWMRERDVLAFGTDAHYFVVTLALLEGVPLLMVGVAVTNNDATAAPNGVIVAGRVVDSRLLDTIRAMIAPSVELLAPVRADAGFEPLVAARAGLDGWPRALVSPRMLEGGLQSAMVVYQEAPDKAMGFRLGHARTLLESGRRAVGLFLLVAVLVASVTIAIAFITLDRWVLRRVARMNTEIEAIADARLARFTDDGVDELGALTRALNRMLARLADSEARERAILDNIEDGYFEIDARGQLLSCSRPIGSLLGYRPEDLVGRNMDTFLEASETERIRELLGRGGAPCQLTFSGRIRRADGSLGHFEARLTPMRDAEGRFAGYRGILRDMSQQVAQQNALRDLAYRDALTGTGNRKAFTEDLGAAIESAGRRGSRFALLFIDLDRFKAVNDRFGHAVGDALLIEIATRLRRELRERDRLYRLGGDEFTVLLSDVPANGAEVLARRLLAQMRVPLFCEGARIDFVTLSVGIAHYPEHGMSVEALLGAADQAMYEAKRRRDAAWTYGQRIEG